MKFVNIFQLFWNVLKPKTKQKNINFCPNFIKTDTIFFQFKTRLKFCTKNGPQGLWIAHCRIGCKRAPKIIAILQPSSRKNTTNFGSRL